MAEQKTQRQDASVPFWGILFLFLGVVFLLQTLDVLPWGLWRTLWRLWPVLLIALGICLVMRRFNVWLVSLIIAALFAGALGITYVQYQATPQQPTGTMKTYVQPIGDITEADINIDFEAGNLNIGSLAASSPNFLEANVNVEVDRENKVLISRKGAGWPFWDEENANSQIDFARSVPTTMNAKLDMTNAGFDLTQLQVSDLRVDSDLTNYNVKIPTSGVMSVFIKADLSTVEIIIPEGVAARMLIQGDLSPVNVDGRRFSLQNGYYVSSDYTTAKNKVELQIDANLSVVEVK